MSEKTIIRVGSRKSELALIQTNHVISLLKNLQSDYDFEIVTMNTLGDKVLDIPLPKIGEKSLFTKELETALISGCVDFVVHSLKDLPTTLPEGMAVGAVLTREDPRDALVVQKDINHKSLNTLPSGSVIGTSSLRRTAQLAKKFPDLVVQNIRGNLNTRLKKLDDLGQFHAIILAAAGLKRIGWAKRITKILDPDEILYAVGQGALAVECRENDEKIIKLLEPLYDIQTALTVISERSFMRTLGGGCSAPVAVCSTLLNAEENLFKLTLQGAVWSLDGTDEIRETQDCDLRLNDTSRCSTCPFNNISNNLEDIECLNQCMACPQSPIRENPLKKRKLDTQKDNLLKEDPHKNCPIDLPIGADFMGKCPYLESGIGDGPSPLSKNGDPTKGTCPFRRESVESNLVQMQANSSKSKESNNLFCGIVPNRGAPQESFIKALNLGIDLANKLIKKGAIEVMSKAQSVIHSSIGNIDLKN